MDSLNYSDPITAHRPHVRRPGSSTLRSRYIIAFQRLSYILRYFEGGRASWYCLMLMSFSWMCKWAVHCCSTLSRYATPVFTCILLSGRMNLPHSMRNESFRAVRAFSWLKSWDWHELYTVGTTLSWVTYDSVLTMNFVEYMFAGFVITPIQRL